MSRSILLSLLFVAVLAAALRGDAGSGAAACIDGCDHWDGQIWQVGATDYCRVWHPDHCFDNKKADVDKGGPCLPALGVYGEGAEYGYVELCNLESCTDVCNAATCPIRHNCEQDGAGGHQGCSPSSSYRRYVCDGIRM